MVQVLMPYPPADDVAPPIPISARITALTGRRIGIVNNGWHCMEIVTDDLREALRRDFGVQEVVEVDITGAQTVPAEQVDRLVSSCDAVVVGIGTCGSCSRWVVHDAIALERRGVPTVSLFTKVFEPLARTVSASDGMPDLPLVILPHPLNPLPDQEIHRIAGDSVTLITDALLMQGVAV
jgi:hypothetical protein